MKLIYLRYYEGSYLLPSKVRRYLASKVDYVPSYNQGTSNQACIHTLEVYAKLYGTSKEVQAIKVSIYTFDSKI